VPENPAARGEISDKIYDRVLKELQELVISVESTIKYKSWNTDIFRLICLINQIAKFYNLQQTLRRIMETDLAYDLTK